MPELPGLKTFLTLCYFQFLRQKSVIIARLQATPQDPELLRGLGEVYLESGGGVSALKLAVRHLEASLQLDETDPRCWQLLGKAWARLHEAPDSATYQPTPEDRDQQVRSLLLSALLR